MEEVIELFDTVGFEHEMAVAFLLRIVLQPGDHHDQELEGWSGLREVLLFDQVLAHRKDTLDDLYEGLDARILDLLLSLLLICTLLPLERVH